MAVCVQSLWTDRGQRQAKVGGLVLHLDLDLVEQRLDSLVLKSVPVSGDKEMNVLFQSLNSAAPAVMWRPRDLLDDVVDGLADDVLHRLCVLLGHPLKPDAEGRLLGAAVISDQQDVLLILLIPDGKIRMIQINVLQVKDVCAY